MREIAWEVIMKKQLGKKTAVGALAGAAGTALLRGMMAGSQRFAPQTLPPMKQDPGEFIVEQASQVLPEKAREKVPAKVESAAATTLAFGYGATFGLLYAATRPKARMSASAQILSEGAALGAAAWALGYLGWLPATKLMPPVWKQRSKQVIPGILSHVVFGVVTVSLFRWLEKKV
jgi:hypothetical protein